MLANGSEILAFLNVGTGEAICIAVVALLLFGKRLPEVMRSLGKGVVEFKKGMRDVEDDLRRPQDEAAPPPQRSLPDSSAGNRYVESTPSSARYVETPPAEQQAK